ncbi:MAG: ATP-binding protein [Clostridia bacterium]|nr:ATP-binding protein [Clostridia bacterium]
MYIQDTYRRVKNDIEQRRQNARATAEERNLALRAKYPEIQQIDEELTKTGLRLFRAAANREDIDAIRRRNLQLNGRRREILVSLGYPEDYTEVHYTCPLCADTGYQGIRMCSCFREALILENIRESGIGHLIDKQTFDNFDLLWYKKNKGDAAYEQMQTLVRFAKAYAEGFGRSSGNLLFMGPTGAGKTHLCTAIASVVIRRGFGVLYDTAQSIIAAFETDRFKNGYSNEPSLSDKYLECDLLIIDDLGTEFQTAFALSCLYNLINTRQNHGLSTIISTNLSYSALTQRYEDRIYSRIIGSDYDVWVFAEGDHRLDV